MEDEWSRQAFERFSGAADNEALFVPPTSFTKSGGIFYADQSNLLRFYKESVDVAIFADNAAHVSNLVVRGSAELPSGFDPFKRIGDSAGPFEKRVKRNGRLLSEMAVSRMIDNFSGYLSDVIG
ncbi:MAG TPA: hypothetical protein VL017_05730, partial [Devosia sp.]|nr:hypothetical protein [Devosia sp.]